MEKTLRVKIFKETDSIDVITADLNYFIEDEQIERDDIFDIKYSHTQQLHSGDSGSGSWSSARYSICLFYFA